MLPNAKSTTVIFNSPLFLYLDNYRQKENGASTLAGKLAVPTNLTSGLNGGASSTMNTTDQALRTNSGNTFHIKTISMNGTGNVQGDIQSGYVTARTRDNSGNGRVSPGPAEWQTVSHVDYKRSSSILKHVTEQSLFSQNESSNN